MATNTIDFGKIYETTNFGNGVDDNTIDWGKVYKDLGGDEVETKFVFSVQTDNSGTSNNDQFTLPLTTSTDLDITVEWGDGNSDSISDHTASEVTHTYASAGEYTIKIDGTLRGFKFNDGGDKLKIKNVSNWGVMRFDVLRAFQGCTNLTCSATDAVVVIGTSLGSTFNQCANFNGAIGNWDVSNVTNMSGMFRDASSFNQNLNDWDVSNNRSFNNMFQGSPFDSDISDWVIRTDADVYMSGMFISCPFNQDISGWDVSRVINMSFMFRTFAGVENVFNQDISGWNVSGVINMESMFRDNEVFDQNLGSWDITSVNNFDDFIRGGQLSTANYDALLIGWEAQNVQDDITINFGNSQYSSGAAATARQALIDDHNWNITDGGQI